MSTFQASSLPMGKDEQRAGYRWNIPILVQVRGEKQDGTKFEQACTSVDVSSSGICVLARLDLPHGQTVHVSAPDEKFESAGTILQSISQDTGETQYRIRFTSGTPFSRQAAQKKYIYDYVEEVWKGYILDGVYHDYKNRPRGYLEGSKIRSLTDGELMFRVADNRVFNALGQSVGHLI